MKVFSLSILLILGISCTEDQIKSNSASKVFENAAVVSAHPLASEVGKDILQNGGNAFDACIAVQFALAVVYPAAGNIGGGGFTVFVDENQKTGCIDYRETAPAGAHRNMYLDSNLNVIKDLSTYGALSSGVPGTVAGMWELHQKYGSMDWDKLVQPSISIAKNGWLLTKREADGLNYYREKISKINPYPNFVQNPNPWKEGDSIFNKNISIVLERIAKNGASDFYIGETAQMIVKSQIENNGLITQDDLKKYKAIWREPVTSQFKGYNIISMPPPSSGGIALISMLKITEKFLFEQWGKWNPKTINLMVEIEKRIYADRSEYLGDPDFVAIPQKELLSDEYLNSLSEKIDPSVITPSVNIKPGLETAYESEQTTHFSIIDSKGNAISTTTTLNAGYGSKLIVKDCGFFMNNEMDDFSVKLGHPNLYGLIGGEANSIEANKRMLSSMTPSIVMDSFGVKLVVGSPGGSTIITSVFQVILNSLVFDYDMQTAVDLPRFHHQWLPDLLFYEKGLFDHVDSLDISNQNLKFRDPIGRVDAIKVIDNNLLECGADSRGDDYAAGF